MNRTATRRALRALRSWTRARRAVRAAYRGSNWSRQAAALAAADRALYHLHVCREAAGMPFNPGIAGIAPPVFRGAA